MIDITINEINEAALGVDSDGSPKSIVIAALQRVNIADPEQDPESIMEVSSVDAVVELKTIGAFSYLDIKFPTAEHSDLSLFFRCLKRYFDSTDDINDNIEDTKIAFISIIPLSLMGEYMINATHPIFFALEPDNIGEAPKTLKLLYLPDDIQYLYADLNEADIERIIEQAEADSMYDFTEQNAGSEGVQDYEDTIKERDYMYTDAKYNPANGFPALDTDTEGES